MADDLCIVHSMHTNAINHDPGKTSFCTGSEIPGKAKHGSLVELRSGLDESDLPDFVVMTSAFWTGGTRNVQALYAACGEAVSCLRNIRAPRFKPRATRCCFCRIPRASTAMFAAGCSTHLGQLNQKHFAEIGDPEIQTTIAQQEMAFRMQTSVPELTDISGEPSDTSGDVWAGSPQERLVRP